MQIDHVNGGEAEGSEMEAKKIVFMHVIVLFIYIYLYCKNKLNMQYYFYSNDIRPYITCHYKIAFISLTSICTLTLSLCMYTYLF